MGEASSSGSAPSDRDERVMMIGGVQVKFPCKPYPSQTQMMFKIIRALDKKNNALLESPTGSGKTLALLCSSLAWLQQEKAKVNARLHVDLSGQPLDGEGRREASEGAANVPSVSGTVAQEPSSSAECKCGCHDPPVPGATVQVKEEQHVEPENSTTANPPTITEPTTPAIVPKTEAPPTLPVSAKLRSQLEAGSTSSTLTCAAVTEPPPAVSKGPCDPVGEDGGKEDFAPAKKKFRHPGVGTKGKKKIGKGIVYENLDDTAMESVDSTLLPNTQGLPSWRMEMKVEKGGCEAEQCSRAAGTEAGGDVRAVAPPVPCTKCDCHSKHKEEELSKEALENKQPKGSAVKLPKIFFATRTHKQIRQVVHELARTAYKAVPMSILASREHYCIHPTVSANKNKNDECKKLLEYHGDCCAYYTLYKRLSTQANLIAAGLDKAWDVEELVEVGRRNTACPYFVSRSVSDEADIIFCPYNYIVDPGIRASMSISVEGHILVFDEGHNMEDAAREAASYTLTNHDLLDVLADIDRVKELLGAVERDKYLRNNPQIAVLSRSYNVIRAAIHTISQWVAAQIPSLPHRGYEEAYKVWYGKDMMNELETKMGITSATYSIYQENLGVIQTARIDLQEDRRLKEFFRELPTMTSDKLSIVEHLFFVIGFMFKDDKKFMEDYRVALSTTTITRVKQFPGERWHSSRRGRREMEKVMAHSLSFWCMNPAVAFSELSSARSVVLTSGTLSPMRSFSSELGVLFPPALQMEANHVIADSQVLVQSVSFGPTGKLLLANYQGSESFEFQDELGLLVAEVCESVKHGVLCFLPSYKMLEKLTQRWTSTGLLSRVEACKLVLLEPRASSRADFDSVLTQFYEAISQSTTEIEEDPEWEMNAFSHRTGALFLAVCRGKVSEGLDFADENARAVITVGIPFPSSKDKQVALKREYNNYYSSSKGLLSGGEWYEIQAFRAINQALGRCIRHRKDWGLLLLVDDRFSKGGKYIGGLSKWVRKHINHDYQFRDALVKLKDFMFSRSQAGSPSVGEASVANCTVVAMETSSTLAPNQSSVAQPSFVPPTSPICPMPPTSPICPIPSTSPLATRILPMFLQSLHAPACPPATSTLLGTTPLPNSLQAGSTHESAAQSPEASISTFVEQCREEMRTSPPTSAPVHTQVCTSPPVRGNTALQSGAPAPMHIASPIVGGTREVAYTPLPLQAASLEVQPQPNPAPGTSTPPSTSQQPLSVATHSHPSISLANDPHILSSPIPKLLAGVIAASEGFTEPIDPLLSKPLSISTQSTNLQPACPICPEPATKEKGLPCYDEAAEEVCMGLSVDSVRLDPVVGDVSQGVITKRKNVRIVGKRGMKRRRSGQAALTEEDKCVGGASPTHTEEVYSCTCCGAALLQCETAETPSEEVKTVSLSGLLSSHYLDTEIEVSELIRALTDTGMDSNQCHVTVWDSDSFWQSAQVSARRCESVVWDAVLGLCLCSVSCATCSKVVGVAVLAANRVDCVTAYVNKVILVAKK